MCGNTPWIHNGNRDQKAQMQLSGRIRDNVWSEHAESAPSGMQAAGVNTSTATQNITAGNATTCGQSMRKQRQALSVPQDVNTNTATQDHSSDTRQRVVRARGISAKWSACRVTPTQTQPRKPQRLLPSAAGSSLTLEIQNLNLYAQGITAGVILCKHSQNFRFG